MAELNLNSNEKDMRNGSSDHQYLFIPGSMQVNFLNQVIMSMLHYFYALFIVFLGLTSKF